MKTVSSDNLARFKAKCDETYQKKGESGGSGGGITEAQVIVQVDEVPATITVDSPSFIQTPDGILYRKKVVESIAILGTWVFNSNINKPSNIYVLSFTSNRNEYTQIGWRVEEGLYYQSESGPDTVYIESSNSWVKEGFRTINITDISSLKNVDEFTQWLTANATGGGASVSYEYIAMQEVPTPTTADNGKVLGVTNGAYALQEASGGGPQLYSHEIQTDEDGAGFTILFIICNYDQPFKKFLDIFDKCSPGLNVNPISPVSSISGTFKIWGDNETNYIECGIVSFLGKIRGLLVYDIESSSLRVLTRSYLSTSTINIIFDEVTPL